MGATPNWIAEMTGHHSLGTTRLQRPPVDDELWIDGCGGYRLAVGSRWTLGGPRTLGGPGAVGESDMEADDSNSGVICIQADVPRRAGELVRNDNDYLWVPDGNDDGESNPVVIGPDHPVPMAGSARLFLTVPSPLSPSAVLSLRPPHRFGGHVDAVVLVTETVLIGPGRECHVRCGGLDNRCILSLVSKADARQDGSVNKWRLVRQGCLPIDVNPNERLTINDVSMTLVRTR